MAVFKVDAFRPLAGFKREVADLAQYLKQTPLAAGSSAIYYPGELEHACAVQRERDGIAVEDSTWAKLATLAQAYGLAQELSLG
jgi:LDH2 family malate/lactate/ureidoglycolate dehydrogenase